MRVVWALLWLLALTGCGGRQLDLPAGAAAYQLIPAATTTSAADYRIGTLDQLDVSVFGEPDLSLKEVRVDASGNMTFPLVGQIHAAGMTSSQLAGTIGRSLGGHYLVNPKVTVNVFKSNSQNVTVDGQVRKPGVYEIPGNLSLVQAVALAEGTTDYAKESEVVVMRTQGTQRYAARFDLADIRAGRAADPRLQNSDVVVVGYSSAKRLFGTIIATLPAVAGLFIAVNQVSN